MRENGREVALEGPKRYGQEEILQETFFIVATGRNTDIGFVVSW